MMRYLGVVSTDGGLVLIADASAAMHWRGIQSDDYDNLCQVFPVDSQGLMIQIKNQDGFVWDIGDSGTVDIFCDDDKKNIVLVHAWLADGNDFSTVERLALIPNQIVEPATRLKLPTGVLAVLWATESGEYIESFDTASQVENGLLDEGSLLVDAGIGYYDIFIDNVNYGDDEANRLFLVAQHFDNASNEQ